jgi:hypothetical protein
VHPQLLSSRKLSFLKLFQHFKQFKPLRVFLHHVKN